MSTVNPNPRGPVPVVRERVTNTVETKIASNPRRQGQRQADEGLTSEPGIAHGTVQGMRDAYAPVNTYERQQAGTSFMGRVNSTPSWTDEGAYMAVFAEGTIRARSERRYESQITPPNGGRGVRNDAEVG